MSPKDRNKNIKDFKVKLNELEKREFQLSASVMNATNNPSLEIRVRELNITRGKIKVLKERIERLKSKSPFGSYNPETISINQNYKNQ